MRRKEGYILQKMAENCYILPYGQNIADYKIGIQVNETGSFLWSMLEKERSKKELLASLADYYHASKEECAELDSDLDEFIKQLSALGILEEESFDNVDIENMNYSRKLIEIGGLFLQLTGPNETFPSEFEPFVVKECRQIHQEIEAIYGDPKSHVNGNILLRNQDLMICKAVKEYVFLFPKAERLLEGHMSFEGDRVTFYYHGARDKVLSTELFHAIRLSYLYLAQKNGCFALHSASILYRDKAWLFSGSSGTGKSTHTNLWKELLQTSVLNGDLNLISILEGVPVIYGIPWCGTSEVCENKTRILGGVVMLRQSQTDRCLKLPAAEGQLLLTQRLISPSWEEEQIKCNIDFSGKLVEKVPVYRLSCTKNPSAVEVVKKQIDYDIDCP